MFFTRKHKTSLKDFCNDTVIAIYRLWGHYFTTAADDILSCFTAAELSALERELRSHSLVVAHFFLWEKISKDRKRVDDETFGEYMGRAFMWALVDGMVPTDALEEEINRQVE